MGRNNIVPPELLELIEHLEEAQAGEPGVDGEKEDRLMNLAKDVQEYLCTLTTARKRRDKTDSRGGWSAAYHEKAGKGERAIPLADVVISAIRSREWNIALSNTNRVLHILQSDNDANPTK